MLAAWCASLVVLSSQAGIAPARDPSSLSILRDGYPRAFFFRACEGGPSRRGADFGTWDATFNRLMGIMGKSLDEEVPGRSRNIDFFTRFKRDHPDQVVLLHFNGNARDPRWEADRFFAGHWVYHNGKPCSTDPQSFRWRPRRHQRYYCRKQHIRNHLGRRSHTRWSCEGQ